MKKIIACGFLFLFLAISPSGKIWQKKIKRTPDKLCDNGITHDLEQSKYAPLNLLFYKTLPYVYVVKDVRGNKRVPFAGLTIYIDKNSKKNNLKWGDEVELCYCVGYKVKTTIERAATISDVFNWASSDQKREIKECYPECRWYFFGD